MTSVPARYQPYVDTAASRLGIPAAVVAAQIDLESGFNPNAVSSAGAEGIAQFEPGTFASYGHGSPFNVADAFNAYIAYMAALLRQEGGDLRRALEAYNAGPGNLPAGAGYANRILAAAGTGDISSSPAGAAPAGFNPLAPLNTLTGWLAGLTSEGNQVLGAIFGPISNVFQDFSSALSVAMTAVLWLVNPMNWVRIFAGIMGTASLITGLILIASAA